ncbi:MAG: hypothetical protein JXR76_11465 [Deltaproteobacteria bacterium]|nr:hypothetical protein [Deltaproteobacteria bacterium]
MTTENQPHSGASSQSDSIDNEPLEIKRDSPIPALMGLLVLIGGIIFAVVWTLGDSNDEISTATSAIEVNNDGKKPIAGPISTIEVTAETPVKAGQKLHVKWGENWYRGKAMQVGSNGEITVHYEDWGDNYDEVVPRERLRLAE